MSRSFIIVFSLILAHSISGAQTSLLNIENGLKSKLNKHNVERDYLFNHPSDDTLSHGFNYVQPMVNYFANHSFDQKFDVDSFGEICQMFTMVGYYKRAILDNEFNFRYGSKSRLKEIQSYVSKYSRSFSVWENCSNQIIRLAASAPITMINEAHDNPFSRSYIMNLLAELKNVGYTHLAMEALAHGGNHLEIDQTTGFYTAEPVMGELIRYALELGYRLVPYEANVTPEMTSIQRDSIQAKNLIEILDTVKRGKVLVIAGYDHINELITDSTHFHPMAHFFKSWTGLDPFTIEQTYLTEYSTNEIARTIYKFLPPRFLKNCKCITPEDVYFKSAINAGKNQDRDIYLIHPRTVYVNGRPTWLTLNGRRQRVRFSIPRNVLKRQF